MVRYYLFHNKGLGKQQRVAIMASIVIKGLDGKIITSPSSDYMVGDVIEITDADGKKNTFKVIGRRWIDGIHLEIMCDYSLRFRDSHDLEDYLFTDSAKHILPELSNSVLESLFSGTFPDNLNLASEKTKRLLVEMDDVAKESGEVSIDLLKEVLSSM